MAWFVLSAAAMRSTRWPSLSKSSLNDSARAALEGASSLRLLATTRGSAASPAASPYIDERYVFTSSPAALRVRAHIHIRAGSLGERCLSATDGHLTAVVWPISADIKAARAMLHSGDCGIAELERCDRSRPSCVIARHGSLSLLWPSERSHEMVPFGHAPMSTVRPPLPSMRVDP